MYPAVCYKDANVSRPYHSYWKFARSKCSFETVVCSPLSFIKQQGFVQHFTILHTFCRLWYGYFRWRWQSC